MFLQSNFNGEGKFVEINDNNINYTGFIEAVRDVYQIPETKLVSVYTNGCELEENKFTAIVRQYFQVPTFQIEIRIKDKLDTIYLPPPTNCISISDSIESGISEFLNKTTSNQANTTQGEEVVELYDIFTALPNTQTLEQLAEIKLLKTRYLGGLHLESSHRQNISKTIIDFCLKDNKNRRVSRDEFVELTRSIVVIFPTEKEETYYIPSVSEVLAKGKLWNYYNNVRKKLRELGHISRKQKSIIPSLPNVPEHEDQIDHLKSLETNSTDWEQIEISWRKTTALRRKQLLTNISTFEYLDKYSVLKDVKGYILAQIDTKIIYPTLGSINKWLSLSSKVIELSRRRTKDIRAINIIKVIDNTFEERQKAAYALLLISYLLPNNGRRSEKTGRTASKSEIQQRFIQIYKSATESAEDIPVNDIKISIIVNQSDEIQYSEFRIAGLVFKLSDPLEALEHLFVYIMAMDVKYPKIIKHVWQFIQLGIYEIQLERDYSPSVTTLIEDLKLIH